MATVVVFLTFLSTAFAGPKAGLYGYYIHDAFHVTADTKCVDVPFRVTYSPVGTCLVLTGGSSVLYSFDPADYSVWQSYYVSNEVCAGASSDTVVSAITPTCVGGGSYYQTGNFFSTKLPTFSGPGYLNAYYGSTGCYDATGVGPAYFVYTSGQASSGEYSPTRFTTLSCSLYSGFSPLLTSYFSTAIASPTHYNGGAEALTGSVEVTQYSSATCADTPTSTTTVPLNSCETDGFGYAVYQAYGIGTRVWVGRMLYTDASCTAPTEVLYDEDGACDTTTDLMKAHTLKCVGCTFNTLTTATPTRLPVQKPSEKPHSTKPVTKPVAKPVTKPTSKQPHKSNVRV